MREIIARALYEHWVEEDFGNEYCSWDLLGDKATWLDRADAVLKAMHEPTHAMMHHGAGVIPCAQGAEEGPLNLSAARDCWLEVIGEAAKR